MNHYDIFIEKINLLMVTIPKHRNALENIKTTVERAWEEERDKRYGMYGDFVYGKPLYIKTDKMGKNEIMKVVGNIIDASSLPGDTPTIEMTMPKP